jgi:raffinose/stachyose/melibiose transport system permease protein
MSIFTVFTLAPLIWLFYSSFKPNRDIVNSIFALPKSFYFKNYITAWKLADFHILILNSIFYAGVSTVVTVFLAMSTGFGFAKMGFKISKVFYFFFIMGLLIVLHSILIPLFLVEKAIGIHDTRIGVLLPYIAVGLPFMVYLATSYVKGIPDAMIEAAFIDGASYLKIFIYVIIPVATPVLATMIIFAFLQSWNEFVLVLTLTSKTILRSLPVGIAALSGSGMSRDYGLQFAALVIGILPMLIFYLAFHRQLAKGFAAGSLKE